MSDPEPSYSDSLLPLENELRVAVSVARTAQMAINIVSSLLAAAGVGYLFCALAQFALDAPVKPLLTRFALALALLLWGPLYLVAAWLTSVARLGTARDALVNYLGHSPMNRNEAAADQWQDPFAVALSDNQQRELRESHSFILVNVALSYFNPLIPVAGVLMGLSGLCAFYGAVSSAGLSALLILLAPVALAATALAGVYFLSPVYAFTPPRRPSNHDPDL